MTSGGKKIAPQPIEARPQAQPARQRSGRARRPPQVRRRAPRPRLHRARTAAAATSAGRRTRARERSCSRAPDVLALYQEIVDALNRELSQFERIKRFALLPAEFSVETGELTPTLKVKRKVVEERWKAEIAKLYNDADSANSASSRLADVTTSELATND